MILYVNGNSHAAAAEAANNHSWAADDSRYFYMGAAPHPDNLAVSWGRKLADVLKMGLHCDAQAGGSNIRIRRTTREMIDRIPDFVQRYFVIIQWSTWERQEWLIDDVWYQIGASGTDSVPDSHRDQYREFISAIDWKNCIESEHQEIWQFHLDLQDLGIPHVFFNGDNHFASINDRRDWGDSYIQPYSAEHTYSAWLKTHGFTTVSAKSWHFGQDAHAAWARFMLKYIVQNQLIPQ
jgi:hypothetical protein